MKRLLISITLLMVLLLSSCNMKKEIRDEKELNYLVEQGTVFYSFNSDIIGFDKDTQIQNISEVTTNNPYTAIIFDCSKVYDKINKKNIDEIYDLLVSKDSKVIVLFLDSPDLSFLKGTKFGGPSGYSKNDNYIEGFFNFFGNTGEITMISQQIETDSETKEATCIISCCEWYVRHNVGEQ